MRIVKPSSVDNVSTERLLDSLDQLNALLADDDRGRGKLIRDGARRTLVIDALLRRRVMFEYDGPLGDPDACRRLFHVFPIWDGDESTGVRCRDCRRYGERMIDGTIVLFHPNPQCPDYRKDRP